MKYIIRHSDVLVKNTTTYLLPPEDANYSKCENADEKPEEVRVSSIEEYIERFNLKNYIEIQVAKHKIIQTDSLESFLKENGEKFEIHWIFEIDHLKKARKYVKSLLVNKYSEN